MSINHEAHALPLAHRLIDAEIGTWLNTNTDLALAGFGQVTEHDRAMRQGVKQMRHLHLDNWDIDLVPAILGSLRRAGLLADTEACGMSGANTPSNYE